MLKGYKIRIYPTKEQEHLIWLHIGSCRFIWNYMLNEQNERQKCGNKVLTNYDMMTLLTTLKKQESYSWLYNISNISLQKTCSDLWTSYKTFFRKNGIHPMFKSKKDNRQKFPVREDRFYFVEKYAHVEKIGNIKYKSDFIFPVGRSNKFKNVHISFVNGKYMLSFSVDCENQTVNKTEFGMGIDLGVKELAVVAYNGQKICFHNINKSKKINDLHRKIARIHRAITRKSIVSKQQNGKYVETKNIRKQIIKLRKAHARITNINMDHIHKITKALIDMTPAFVVMEDLSVNSMLKTRYLKKQVKEQRFAEFISTMKYKCQRYGIEFIQADRYYPSSRLCSNCGNKKKTLRLNDRVYICDCCGLTIDRDYNAALNLIKYANSF